MTSKNTETMKRYNKYRKSEGDKASLSLETLKKQIDKLHEQEFMMSVPIGGAEDGR